MKFNVNKIPEHIERRRRRKWHEAFAWTPQKVDRTDEGHSVIWFEKYMRQERAGPTNNPKHDGIYWRQYSMKEYFKRKLNGDFDIDRNKQEGDGATQADTRTVGGVSSAGLTGPNKILMKTGQFDSNKYKRDTI